MNQMIGLAVYHSSALPGEDFILGRLVESIENETEEALAYVDGQLEDTGKFVKVRKLSATVLNDVQEQVATQRLSAIAFHQQHPRAKSEGTEGISFHLEVAPRRPRGREAVSPYRLYALIPQEAFSPELGFRLSMVVWQHLQAQYGFIHVGNDHADALMEVTADVTPET